LTEEQSKPDLAGLIADIAIEECRKLYEKRLIGLEEELAALYRTLEQYTHPT
jgi:ubiquitin